MQRKKFKTANQYQIENDNDPAYQEFLKRSGHTQETLDKVPDQPDTPQRKAQRAIGLLEALAIECGCDITRPLQWQQLAIEFGKVLHEAGKGGLTEVQTTDKYKGENAQNP